MPSVVVPGGGGPNPKTGGALHREAWQEHAWRHGRALPLPPAAPPGPALPAPLPIRLQSTRWCKESRLRTRLRSVCLLLVSPAAPDGSTARTGPQRQLRATTAPPRLRPDHALVPCPACQPAQPAAPALLAPAGACRLHHGPAAGCQHRHHRAQHGADGGGVSALPAALLLLPEHNCALALCPVGWEATSYGACRTSARRCRHPSGLLAPASAEPRPAPGSQPLPPCPFPPSPPPRSFGMFYGGLAQLLAGEQPRACAAPRWGRGGRACTSRLLSAEFISIAPRVVPPPAPRAPLLHTHARARGHARPEPHPHPPTTHPSPPRRHVGVQAAEHLWRRCLHLLRRLLDGLRAAADPGGGGYRGAPGAGACARVCARGERRASTPAAHARALFRRANTPSVSSCLPPVRAPPRRPSPPAGRHLCGGSQRRPDDAEPVGHPHLQ